MLLTIALVVGVLSAVFAILTSVSLVVLRVQVARAKNYQK